MNKKMREYKEKQLKAKQERLNLEIKRKEIIAGIYDEIVNKTKQARKEYSKTIDPLIDSIEKMDKSLKSEAKKVLTRAKESLVLNMIDQIKEKKDQLYSKKPDDLKEIDDRIFELENEEAKQSQNIKKHQRQNSEPER